MLDAKRNLFRELEKKVGRVFSFLPLSPNQYTLISILFILISFYFLIKKNLILAIIFFLLASFLDFVDGAVARYKNVVTKVGAYLDTVCDRYVEGILLFGLLFLPLPKILMPPAFWIFLILFGSMMTTYVKAAAKEKDLVKKELKGGIMSKGERTILLLIALILGIFNFTWITYLLIIIALLVNFTALQRINFAFQLAKF